MTPGPRSARRRRTLAAGASIAAVVAVLAAGGEVVARVVIADRVEHAAQRLGLPEGMQVRVAEGLLLPSLATGRVPLDATITSADVGELARCLPAATETELSIENGEIIARSLVTVRAATMPVTVMLSPVITAGGLRLEAGDISVAGLHLPPAAVDRLLSGLPAGERLAEGVDLGNLLPSGVTVRDVDVDDASMRLGLDVPVQLAHEDADADEATGRSPSVAC